MNTNKQIQLLEKLTNKKVILEENDFFKQHILPKEEKLERRLNSIKGILIKGGTYKGDLDLKDIEELDSLYNLERVEGSLSLRGTSIKDLGKLEYVGGVLNLRGSRIKDLGKLEYVGGYLDLENSQIESLPDNLIVKRKVLLSKALANYPDSLTGKIYINKVPYEKIKKVEGFPVVSLKIGRKVRQGNGEKGTYEQFKSRIGSISTKNIKGVEEKLNIIWNDMIIYYIPQSDGFDGRIATAFAILGEDDNGKQYMYSRHETASPQAGQTHLLTETNVYKVSDVLRGGFKIV